MNMILDTTLSGPEAILVVICTSFILGIFWHAGNRISADEGYDEDYLDGTGVEQEDLEDGDEQYKGIL